MHIPEPVVDNRSIREYAQHYVMEQWEEPKQWQCLNLIVKLESEWKPNLLNKETNAYGLGQIIGSKKYTKNKPRKQIRKMVEYITNRYPTSLACQALAHHKRWGWY